jgi:hypothetical protein
MVGKGVERVPASSQPSLENKDSTHPAFIAAEVAKKHAKQAERIAEQLQPSSMASAPDPAHVELRAKYARAAKEAAAAADLAEEAAAVAERAALLEDTELALYAAERALNAYETAHEAAFAVQRKGGRRQQDSSAVIAKNAAERQKNRPTSAADSPSRSSPDAEFNNNSAMGAFPSIRTPAINFAEQSRKIDSLVQGSAAVSAPSTAKQGDTFSVFLRVSPERLAVLTKGFKDEFPENLTIKGRQGVRLTSRMMASLSGLGFEITPKDGQMQAVSATDTTTWAWQVKARDSGLQTLTFTLSGMLNIEGTEVARNFFQYQQKIEVDIEFNFRDFLMQNWQWLATTLAIPFIGALWAFFRKPKDSEGKSVPSYSARLRGRRR